MEAPFEAQHSDPSESPSGDSSIFPVPYPTAMFQKSLQKDKIDTLVVTVSLSYVPLAAILQLYSLNMLLQDTSSEYPADIYDSNE